MARVLAYKWSCVVGLAFLATFAWAVVSRDRSSDLFNLASALAFLASLVGSAVILVTRKSREGLYRVVLNAAFCLLIFPTIWLGSVVRDKILLARLPRFQQAADALTRSEMAIGKHDASVHVVPLPPGFSDLNVRDSVLVRCETNDVMMSFLDRDSNALGTAGLMFRSDDSERALRRDYPNIGYTHLAPHWFFFSE